MLEKEPYPNELIIDYLSDNITPDQLKELEAWISKDRDNRKYVHDFTEIWLASNVINVNTGKKEAAYRSLKRRIEKKRGQLIIKRSVQLVASVFIAALLIGSGFYLNRKEGGQIKHMVQTIEVPLGSRTRIVLADGSIAWLNAGSKLSYPLDKTENIRRINLEGEGYFEVFPDKESPFIVHTSDIDVEVLGTRFNVKAYGDENEIEVILAEGSVNFINKRDLQTSFIMKPSQHAIYNKMNGKIEIRKVPVLQANDWTKGTHFFNELTFEQIAKQLEKSFNVSIVFRNEDKKKLTFYGDFKSEYSLNDILDIMSSSGKFKYKKTESKIEIF